MMQYFDGNIFYVLLNIFIFWNLRTAFIRLNTSAVVQSRTGQDPVRAKKDKDGNQDRGIQRLKPRQHKNYTCI